MIEMGRTGKADGNPYELLTHDVQEGTFTVDADPRLMLGTGSKVKTGVFGSQVFAENFLKLGTKTGSVAPVAAGELATHYNPYEPEGNVPSVTTTEDNLEELRSVAAEVIGPGEYLFPLSPTNAAIVPGDNLYVVSANGGLDKTTGTTNIAVSKETKAANEGGYITVHCTGPITVKS
jgi:hypothetical protein